MRVFILILLLVTFTTPLKAAPAAESYLHFLLDHKSVGSETKKLLRKLDNARASSPSQTLQSRELRLLATLKIEVEAGKISRKTQNDIEAAIDPDLRDLAIQSETADSRIEDFNALLKYLNVFDAYTKNGASIERELIHQLQNLAAKRGRLAGNLDAKILSLSAAFKEAHIRTRMVQALNSGKPLDEADRNYLRSLATRLKSLTEDEDLIHERIGRFLERIETGLPLAQAVMDHTFSAVPKGALNQLGWHYLSLIISPRVSFFEQRMMGLSSRAQNRLEVMRTALRTPSLRQVQFRESEIKTMIRILEDGLRKFQKSDRVYLDFARWLTRNPYFDRALAGQIQSLQQNRNTAAHRLSRWMNSSVTGMTLTTLISLTVLTSVGMETANQFYDPRLPGWSEQLRLIRTNGEVTIDWALKKCAHLIQKIKTN